VHAHVRGSAHSLSISELPLILGLLLASPHELVAAQVLGPAVVLAFTRGHSPLKLVFNLGQFGLTACLAVITLHVLVPDPQALGPGLWLAVFAAVLSSSVAGAALVVAAITLAEGVAGSEPAFVARMNRRARELGLTATRFANSHGFDAPGHRSSVRDLVTLARAAMRHPVFREAVSRRRATIPGPNGAGTRSYLSENVLLDIDPDVDGVKTGMTDGAGYALVAHSRRRPTAPELYAALIGARSEAARAREGERLLDLGRSRYAPATLIAAGAVFGRVPVDDRPGTAVAYRAAAPLVAPLRLGEPVTETVTAPPELSGPVAAGEVIGSVTLRQGERVLGRRDLVTAESAGAPGVWDRVRAGVEALVP
jgi:D-alanyl-D-alanine carboxypeptidase